MNVLFVLYAGLECNSAVHLRVHAKYLAQLGHRCAVAIPEGDADATHAPGLRAVPWGEALSDPGAIFEDGRAADVIHAWTPREGVRRFITSYMAKRPTPWIVYLEDNEAWIAGAALSKVRIAPDVMLEHTEATIALWTPPNLAHPLRFRAFIGLADSAVVIQPKLSVDVPPWVPCSTVMPGVELGLFEPAAADAALRAVYAVADDERVIVYPGGLNGFTRPGIQSLCRAVGLINQAGVRCRLLRSGPVPLDFLDEMPSETRAMITDLGPLPRERLPSLFRLAEVFVQPGSHDPFEDLRLPAKLPEFFAAGRPVVLPDTNIAGLLHDGVDAVFLRSGEPQEIASRCIELFRDTARAQRIGEAGRRFALAHFDPREQAQRLESAYRAACASYDARISTATWEGATDESPVQSLLSRRLRLLAERDVAAKVDLSPLLAAHADAIDGALARQKGLEAAIDERDQRLQRLGNELEEKERRVQELGTLAHDFRTRYLEAMQALSTQEASMEAMHRSASWRLTAPLRALGAIISRVRRGKR